MRTENRNIYYMGAMLGWSSDAKLERRRRAEARRAELEDLRQEIIGLPVSRMGVFLRADGRIERRLVQGEPPAERMTALADARQTALHFLPREEAYAALARRSEAEAARTKPEPPARIPDVLPEVGARVRITGGTTDHALVGKTCHYLGFDSNARHHVVRFAKGDRSVRGSYRATDSISLNPNTTFQAA